MRRRFLASASPHVVLLGKGKNPESTEIFEILNTIQPTFIPSKLIDSVYVTLVNEDDDKKRFAVDKRFYSKGIDYRNIERDLDELGLRQIEQVEIILNLDKAGKNVKAEVSDLLEPFFKNK